VQLLGRFGGRVIAPSCDSIAATSTCHVSLISSLAASSVTMLLIRVARPNAIGLASARMSVSALMLPCSVLLEQHAFGGHQPVLLERGVDRRQQRRRRTGLGQEPKDAALVYGRDRRSPCRIARSAAS